MPPVTSADFSHYEDAELHTFVTQFRRMVDQVSRDTEEGLGHLSPESSEESREYLGNQHEYNPYTEGNLLYDTNGRLVEISVEPYQIQVLGRMVHRMPTITSIGSGEQSSRATSKAYSSYPPLGERSLPSSRSNTVENDLAGQPHPRQGIH
jgi:hypothetical protein